MKPLKTFLKNFLAALLGWMAHGVILKYKPIVVMVTGSVGKTSTKDAVAAALAEKFYLRKSEKSENSEFGVPFTILGVKNPWGNPLAWLGILGEALALWLLPNHYPKLLVLEVGADQPGDLAKILRIVTPDAVVVTLLPDVPVHVEAYATPAEVRDEEFAPAMALPQGAPLIVNADDHYALELATRTAARVYTFGTSEDADVRIEKPQVWMDGAKPSGMEAMLEVEEKSYVLQVSGSFGRSQLFAPAAAVATALALDMTPKQALKGLHSYNAPPGRGRLFAGIKNTVLIDDSYNASPVAVSARLESLALIPAAPAARRKVAILGDMLELGRYSLEEHQKIGKLAAGIVNAIITVGNRSKAIGDAAIAEGMSEGDVYHFANSKDAAIAVSNLIDEGDIVLIKGSQSGVRLERVVKVLLANPADSRELVRQDAAWLRR